MSHSNLIHPTVIMIGDVEVGAGTSIGPYSVIQGPVKIGAGNEIGAHVVIGGAPEHRSKGPAGMIVIGDHNRIRDHVVIHHGCEDTGTVIGSGCYIMGHVHIAHDGLIQDEVTISLCAAICGHVKILRGANIGANAVIHQRSVIGHYAMVGMGSVVAKDVPPLALVKGNPARYSRQNTHVLKSVQVDLNVAQQEFEMLSKRPRINLHQ